MKINFTLHEIYISNLLMHSCFERHNPRAVSHFKVSITYYKDPSLRLVGGYNTLSFLIDGSDCQIYEILTKSVLSNRPISISGIGKEYDTYTTDSQEIADDTKLILNDLQATSISFTQLDNNTKE